VVVGLTAVPRACLVRVANGC